MSCPFDVKVTLTINELYDSANMTKEELGIWLRKMEAVKCAIVGSFIRVEQGLIVSYDPAVVDLARVDEKIKTVVAGGGDAVEKYLDDTCDLIAGCVTIATAANIGHLGRALSEEMEGEGGVAVDKTDQKKTA